MAQDPPSPPGSSSSHEEAKKELGPPSPVGFWDHQLRHTRKSVFIRWAATTLTLMTFILGVLSIYWGSFMHAVQNLSALQIAVVDFDGLVAPYSNSGITPVFGPAVVEAANAQLGSGEPTLGWMVIPASQFDFDPIKVRQAVYDETYWGAVIINANATYEATMALESGNESYDPTGAAQVIIVSARDDTTVYDYLLPVLYPFLAGATSEAGKAWASSVFSNSNLQANLAKVPQAVSPGISYAQYDLRPFFPYQAVPSESVGLIYLIILSFFSFSFYIPIYMRFMKPEGHPPLKGLELVIVRYIGTQAAYFLLSLAYSLISVAFQIDFSSYNPIRSQTEVVQTIDGYSNAPYFGPATFVVYWTLNWIGMMALGLACENMAMFLGMPWTGLWLIFWVITNVTTSFSNLAVLPGFYHWGYAWPLHNVVQATRTLLFDVKSHLGLNFGVLLAWVVVNTVLFPFACRFMKYKVDHKVKEYWA